MQTKAGQQPYWICTFHTGIFQLPLMVMLHTTVSKQFNGARSHILRDAEFESVDESKTMLYEKLRLLYHNAKQISLQPDAHVHYDSSVISCMAIANTYKNLNCKFGDKLARATPNLFTFLKYPGMEPTNNESERMLRKVVISRKIRQRLVTEMDMKI